jgi:hypothetical protein
MIQSDLHAESRDDILRVGLTETEDPLFLINPTLEMMREFVHTHEEVAETPPVRLFADGAPLKDLTDDFLIASTLSDLVAEDTVSIRVLDRVPRHSLVVSEQFVLSLVEAGSHVRSLPTTEESFVESTYEYYDQLWKRADTFSLRTPPLSHIRETLEEDIGPSVATDFDRVLDTLDSASGNGEALDEVTICLLVAAKNGELLYDISRWGEDIRLASKATFSRCKNQLEDNGLIDTEKVPIEVGRPRLRLRLGDGDLQDADIEEVAQRAETHLG